MQSPQNVRVVCMAGHDDFFLSSPLHGKENDEHALDFALHLSRPFVVSVSLNIPCTTHVLFSGRLSNRYQGLRDLRKF
jgi:hypothetical protein